MRDVLVGRDHRRSDAAPVFHSEIYAAGRSFGRRRRIQGIERMASAPPDESPGSRIGGLYRSGRFVCVGDLSVMQKNFKGKPCKYIEA